MAEGATLFRPTALVVILLSSPSAHAQTPAEPSPIVLQPIPRFPDEAAARRGCPADAVVWADRDNGYFYPKVLPQYGHTAHGAFSCLDAARKAGYWNANPFSDKPLKGREFPIDPALLGTGV